MIDLATFAAGCFWGVEEVFRTLPGVVSTRVGYTGGHTENPTYKDVCGHTTGHAEAVEITFDPAVITYEQLLDKFWEFHDPTTLNRQGPDVGDQYRSAIFYHNESQKKSAEKSRDILAMSEKYTSPIVTEITPATTFYEAEEYHQKYVMKNGGGVCHI